MTRSFTTMPDISSHGGKLLLSALASMIGLASVGGCGLWHRVDRDLLEKVANEDKLLLFDTENGVYISKDEIQAAERAVEDAERALDRAEDFDDFIDARSESGASIDTPAVLELLDQWNDARIEMREIELERAEQMVLAAEAQLWASRARYEEAKAILVKEHNPEDGSDIDLEDFQSQVKDLEVEEQAEKKKLEEIELRLSEKRNVYNTLSLELQRKSEGAYGGPWADLGG